MLPAGTINFPATDLNQVLEIYGQLVGKTILRPESLPNKTIALKTQTPLTKKEAAEAFKEVLSLNGIAAIDVGDKFVKIVPSASAGATGAPYSVNVLGYANVITNQLTSSKSGQAQTSHAASNAVPSDASLRQTRRSSP